MKRPIILMAALILGGCEPDGNSNPPEPRFICTQVTEVYGCGRGGTCERCGNWQIGCPKPLELQEVDSRTGTLICRMARKPATCTLTTDPNDPGKCRG